MLECPSCRQALPLSARFCAHCGERLPAMTSAVTATGHADMEKPATDLPAPARPSLDDISAQETLMQALPAGFFQRASQADHTDTPEKPARVISLRLAGEIAGTYTLIKSDLAEQSTKITAAMDSLLPFVYENHRAENQALFVSTLKRKPPLDDAVWGRVAFVLGAYGNYLYRYPLDAEQKQQVWRALLWAVYYERCYRRKYLAQRSQQLLHFFQGCAQDSGFLAVALVDLHALCFHLETSSLTKWQEALHQLPAPPADLLQHINAQIAASEQRKQERQAFQQAQPAQRSRKLAPTKRANPAILSTIPQKQRRNLALVVNGAAALASTSHEPAENAPMTHEPAVRELLGFFTDEQCQDFFASLRAARLEAVNQLLQAVRRPLLASLCQVLLAAGPLVYQEPRRTIRLGKKHADRFSEAHHLLSSTRSDEQQVGLRLFEQGARETTHPDYALLAHEWMLYARAIVRGSPCVVDDWESLVQRDMASWEERWNLALFYQQTGYPAEALRVLEPGLDRLRAPVAHLRLALVCALDLLLQTDQSGSLTQPFLLAHLERWPHPLSCLAWLVLAYETHGSPHPRQQSQRLSTFQDLLEYPVTLLDPRKDLSEARVAALEEALVEKTRCDEAWFLWINDHAEHYPRKYQAWARLAETSERLGRLDVAEMALQHVVEIQYHNDYAYYQEGDPLPRAKYLRNNLGKLFGFYQRHQLYQQGAEAFQSCYPALSHLWDSHDPANRKLITLTSQYLEARQREEAETDKARHEVSLRELSRTVTAPLEHFKPGLRVGIFVDYENIARFIPREMDAEEVGKALAAYAAQFGEVACQWASASPQNLSNLADVRLGLEAAHFKVRFPRRELQFSPSSKKNLADFALLECLSEARVSDRLDIYLIVSGDRDYYERICSLLDAGSIVRILAAADSQHLSSRYRELEQQCARERQAAGHAESNFFIDDLEEILYPLVSLN